MYGLLIESLSEHLKISYGDKIWDDIRRGAELDLADFSIQQVYPEQTLPRIVSSASKVLNINEKELMEAVGVHFVNFVSRYGYDRMLSVLGRHMRDFLNGLDNLHEYMRFSYPRMRPPSFFCENEDKNGLTLHYRTRRRGYLYYTIGQIKAVGELFYHTPVKIEIMDEEVDDNVIHVVMRLNFDNHGFDEDTIVILHEDMFQPVEARVLFELFPFSIVFDEKLEINVLGNSLQLVMTDALGRNLNEVFTLVRPALDFTWDKILSRTNNVFELMSIDTIHHNFEHVVLPQSDPDDPFSNVYTEKCLQLKGQMLYMQEWNSVIYLGTPVMPDLDAMIQTGLYINDLSMYDFSRDLMLAGTQQSVELRLALDQEQKKTKRLEESMKKLDEEMKRTDQLLYQMIPKEVANRLRNGETAVNTCEVFDSVTILFSDVVTFTEMCSRITPMEVVTLLNLMYSLFDNLTEKHNVYKVETIGDAYMVVAGAPDRTTDHAVKIADMALDMTHVITGLRDPSTNKNIRIRVGIHSGNVVAGVVGVKMPRYCLFGDAVNTTSRMESTSEPMKIQISVDTKRKLPPIYKLEDRGSVSVKGKGRMRTYWLVGKEGYEPPTIESQETMMMGASPSYSPAMFGETILQRDTFAYSVLSAYSTPSRPPTVATLRGDETELAKLEMRISSPTPTLTVNQQESLLVPINNIVTPTVVIQEPPNSPIPSAVVPAIQTQLVAPSDGVKLNVPQLRKRSRDGDINFNSVPVNKSLIRENVVGNVNGINNNNIPVSNINSIENSVDNLKEKVEVPAVQCNFQCQSTSCGVQ